MKWLKCCALLVTNGIKSSLILRFNNLVEICHCPSWHKNTHFSCSKMFFVFCFFCSHEIISLLVISHLYRNVSALTLDGNNSCQEICGGEDLFLPLGAKLFIKYFSFIFCGLTGQTICKGLKDSLGWHMLNSKSSHIKYLHLRNTCVYLHFLCCFKRNSRRYEWNFLYSSTLNFIL